MIVKRWYGIKKLKDGELHCESGPAIKTIFGERYYFLEGQGYLKIEWDNMFTITLFSGRRQNIHKIYKSSFWVRLYMYILRQWRKLIIGIY